MCTDDKARVVREMFGSIARRYDFLNHFLSANFDRRWRRACVREVARLCPVSCPRILDVGCGTADLAIACSRLGPVLGCDFSHPMVRLGLAKAAKSNRRHPVQLLEGDALRLPFRDAGFDAVVSAFVLRNLADISKGLSEMRRMLRPGGVLAILDFGLPDGALTGRAYRFYFTRVLPGLGRLISGVDGPYRYLPESVSSFPRPAELIGLLGKADFSETEYRSLSGGIAVLLLGRVRA